MLKVSKLSDYAILIAKMLHENNLKKNLDIVGLSANEISINTKLPKPTVSKLLKIMTKNGLLTAQRGALGGYRLNDSLQGISLLSFMEIIDGKTNLIDCLEKDTCYVQNCSQKKPWALVNNRLRAVLKDIKLDIFFNDSLEQK